VRKVHTVTANRRFEIVAGAVICNTNSPAEALRLARLDADTGSRVSVRDRSKRRGYLTEIELESLSNA
jgi:hypothetical protein